MNESHPYIPNSAPDVRAAMIEAVGASSIEDLFGSIPGDLRLGRELDLPAPLSDEVRLARHLDGLLARNTSAGDVLSFLGGACWRHHVPAVVDEITGRAEFLTSYGGGPYADLGKYQAIFEFQSMVGELVGMEVVSSPTYDWVTAATSSLLMACRITGRARVVLPATVNPDLLAHLRTFAQPWADVTIIPASYPTGSMDRAALAAALGPDVAAVYVENPSFLGFVEGSAPDIAAVAHEAGALCVVGVDASTLGALAAPADYGADIVCGDVQALGAHPLFGGGQCGFIAHRDEEAYVLQNPAILISAVPSLDGSATGFAWSTMARTSYDLREAARDYTGTSQWLWGIGTAVHLALLGPTGLGELADGWMARVAYAIDRLVGVPGLRVPVLGEVHLKELVVGFDGTGLSVGEINRRLRDRGIFGGRDLSRDVPWLGQSALFAFTELHTREDIDQLAATLREIVR